MSRSKKKSNREASTKQLRKISLAKALNFEVDAHAEKSFLWHCEGREMSRRKEIRANKCTYDFYDYLRKH